MFEQEWSCLDPINQCFLFLVMQVECYFIYQNNLVAQLVDNQLTLPSDYVINQELAKNCANRIARDIGAKLLDAPKLISVCKLDGHDMYSFFAELEHFVPASKRQHVWSQAPLLTFQEASHLAEKQLGQRSPHNNDHRLTRLTLISTIYQLYRHRLLKEYATDNVVNV